MQLQQKHLSGCSEMIAGLQGTFGLGTLALQSALFSCILDLLLQECILVFGPTEHIPHGVSDKVRVLSYQSFTGGKGKDTAVGSRD